MIKISDESKLSKEKVRDAEKYIKKMEKEGISTVEIMCRVATLIACRAEMKKVGDDVIFTFIPVYERS